MQEMTQKIVDYFERQAFGVCEWWGKRLGIETRKVRISFIYVSFATLGSPLIVYLFMAFIKENKHYFKPGAKRPSVWDI